MTSLLDLAGPLVDPERAILAVEPSTVAPRIILAAVELYRRIHDAGHLGGGELLHGPRGMRSAPPS